MKKLKLVALALMIVLALAVPALAEQVNVYENNQLVKSVVFKISVSEYVVNSQTPGVKMDVAPFIQNDRAFVPVRFLGNALGLSDNNITWDNNSQIATLKGNAATLQMTIEKAQITSNGTTKAIDVAPVLTSDRTFLPARFVAEGLGYQVAWDDATQTVVCWPAGQPQPDVSAAVNYLNGQAQQQPAPQPAPTAGKVPNGGYVIPANTDLKILVDKDGYYPKGQIDFQIQLKKGNLQQQYTDAKSILSQIVDPDTVNTAIEFAKVTQEALLFDKPWDIKTFKSPNGMAVRVGGGWGDTVEFQLWQTN